eukprot:evm.model.scf_517.3 EVM.evm.TU.scf_517.3   scf_517:21670-22092(-)
MSTEEKQGRAPKGRVEEEAVDKDRGWPLMDRGSCGKQPCAAWCATRLEQINTSLERTTPIHDVQRQKKSLESCNGGNVMGAEQRNGCKENGSDMRSPVNGAGTVGEPQGSCTTPLACTRSPARSFGGPRGQFGQPPLAFV